MPLPSWAEAQRAQDDAHTLTLPAHPHALPVLGAGPGAESAIARVEVPAGQPAALTLTF